MSALRIGQRSRGPYAEAHALSVPELPQAILCAYRIADGGVNLGFQTWAFAIYLLTTSLKGVSSMKLHRDLGVM